MKSLLSILVILFIFSQTSSFCGETAYAATMKGIECAACKKSIAKSLGRLEGVKTIRITPAKNGTHRLAVLTDGSSPISRSDAVEALGKNAPHYEIVSWSKSN